MSFKGCCSGIVVMAVFVALYQQLGAGWFWGLAILLTLVFLFTIKSSSAGTKAKQAAINEVLSAGALGDTLPVVVAEATLGAIVLESDGEAFSQEVVGESFYSQNFADLRQTMKSAQGEWLPLVFALVVDAKNEHDANAVAVTSGGGVLGYIPAESAAEFQAFILPRGGIAQVQGQVRFNTDDGLNSVRLDVQRPLKISLAKTKQAIQIARDYDKKKGKK